MVESLEDGVPAFLLTSTHVGGRFRIVKRVIADPRSDSVLMQIRLEDLGGGDLRLFALCARRISSTAAPTTRGWRGDYKGHGMLFAEGDGALSGDGRRPAVPREFGRLRRRLRRLAAALATIVG